MLVSCISEDTEDTGAYTLLSASAAPCCLAACPAIMRHGHTAWQAATQQGAAEGGRRVYAHAAAEAAKEGVYTSRHKSQLIVMWALQHTSLSWLLVGVLMCTSLSFQLLQLLQRHAD